MVLEFHLEPVLEALIWVWVVGNLKLNYYHRCLLFRCVPGCVLNRVCFSTRHVLLRFDLSKTN